MKKAFTLALLSFGFLFQQANAQIGKGEKMLGGSIGFTSSKSDYDNASNFETETSSFVVTPQLGFGLGKNWIVGVGLSYASSKQEARDFVLTTEAKVSAVSPGIFVRKFHQFGDKFGIYGQADAQLAFGKMTSRQGNNPEAESDINGYSIALSPGAFFKASKRIVIEASVGSLGYSSTTTKPEGSNVKLKTSQFSLALTNSLSLGFKVIF